MLILYSPIIRFKESKIQNIEFNFSIDKKVLFAFAVSLGIILMLLLLLYLSKGLVSDFGQLYSMGKEGVSIFPHFVQLLHTIYSIFHIPLLVLLGYYLSLSNKSTFVLLILFMASSLPSVLYGIGGASRGMLFFRLFDFLIVFLLFRKFINIKIQRVINVVGIISVILLGIVSFSITSSRFGEGDIVVKVISQYFGESFLNANLHFYGNLDEALNGERFFPDIYKIFEGDLHTYKSKHDSWSYYHIVTNTRSHYFKTLIMDFYLEFGAYGAIISIFVLGLIGLKFLKSEDKVPLYRYIWIIYYYQICFGAVFDFTKGGHDNMVRFIGLFLVYIFLRVDFFNLRFKRA